MIIDGNKITPGDGYARITNGEVYSTLVYLGKNDSPTNWHDTNDEPPDPDPELDGDEVLEILLGVD